MIEPRWAVFVIAVVVVVVCIAALTDILPKHLAWVRENRKNRS